MKSEKNKLIREIIIDCVFVIILIIVTIYGVIYIFPEINKVDVLTIDKFECEYAYDCVCEGKKCSCKYCLDNNCDNIKNITCKK